MSKKLVYLYNPINNAKSPIDYETLSGITGIGVADLMCRKNRCQKIKTINSYIIDSKTPISKLREFMEKEVIENEVWKEITACTTGRYFISDHGRIKKVFKRGKERLIMPYIKRTSKNIWLYVKITRNEKLSEHTIHRLVAEHFIPNPKRLPCVRHKDNNIQNNFAGNLEWSTYEKLGTVTRSLYGGTPVCKIDKVTGEVLEEYRNMAEAGRANYLHRETIRQVIKGIRKSAGGFCWKKIDEDNFDEDEEAI